MSENYFSQLYAINVNGNTEKKGNLTYLSWVWAWAEVKKLHPDATYTVYENAEGLNYHTDGMTCWVKTGVTVNGIEHIEYLPVMDSRNKSISAASVTSFDVNKAIQRSITKACARHGLGLYIYAGEDLPETEKPDSDPPPTDPPRQPAPPPQSAPQQKRMAVAEQKKFIVQNASNELKQNAITAYGAELENLTFSAAEKIIARIQGGESNAG